MSRFWPWGGEKFDFGIDETAEFTNQLGAAAQSLRDKLATARGSMWPEGELRKQFPRVAGVFLLGSELSRLIGALRGESNSMTRNAVQEPVHMPGRASS
jgi:hypothetical protein